MKTLCPDDEKLSNYVSGGLTKEEKITVENHISGCKTCLEKLSLAFKADTLYKEGRLAPPSQEAIVKAQRIAKPKQKTKKNLWLFSAIAAFALSFLFPRYFLQCLTATILLGIKWILESENMRTLILVIDSWRRHEHARDDEISQRLKDRGDVKLNSK